ncbi:Uncharacterized protein PYUK71.03c [Auxenochlorella protothecoides]|uniref:Uncharacterized protein PYUK71.03c n=1 Tax=Auxenochlorella protothecoides TaxID=3075 RepID=A0A087SJF1_AUXPR|nr:Uncharacterized protein PYUK71.03c [Auxenochlorella protothecoides]KFM25855.1 Uncharacterized protein PYUK71.03c [Auxenochlorella protothecoides]
MCFTPSPQLDRAGAQLPGGQRRRRHTSPPRTRVLCALGLRSLRAPPALLSRDARLVLLGGLAATLVWFALSFLGTLPSVRAALRRFVWWRGAARAAPRLAPEARAALEREALRSTDSDEVPAAGAAPLPDGEDVEWFNMCWRKVWRVYQRGIESWLAEMLQPVLDGVVTDSPVPAMLKRIRIMEVNLDHEAPYFSNMRRRSSRKASLGGRRPDIWGWDSKGDSDLSGVVDLRYTGGAQVVLALEVGQGRWKAKIPVLVSDLDVEATVWLKLRLAPMAPYIGAVSFAFVGPPAIKIQLAPYGRVRLMNIPVLQPILSRLLTVALPGLMTLPQRLDIDVPPAVTAIAEAAVGRDAIMRAADALEHALLAALPLGPQGDAGGVSLPDFFTGELQVTLVEARALPVWGFPWQSNPYCRLTLGGQAVQSRRDSETSHASRHRAPAWNQEFTFLVEDPRVQVLEIVVRDSPITGRTEVGRVVFPLARLPSEGVLKAWLPVVTDATGMADVGPGAGGKSSDGSADEDGALPDKERPAAPGPGPDPRGVPSLPAYAGPADDLLPSSMQNGSVSAPDSAPSPRGLRQLADAASSVEDLVQLRGALRLLTQEIDELGGSGTAGSTGAAAELVASAEREATQAVLAGDVAGAVQALRFAARAVETTLAQAGARGMQAGGEGGDGRCVETEGSDAGRRGVDEEANSSGREPEFEALHSSQTTESDQPVPAWVVFWALSASVTAIYLALLLQNAHHLK